MPQLQRLRFLLYRVAHVGLFIAFLLMPSLTCLYSVAFAADRARPQIDPQLQRPLDIPLERLERPLRTPTDPIKPIDLNRASIEQLAALPGMNATVAQQIIEGRPYRDKTDLTQKHILSDAAYDRIKHLLAIE
ncbi:MAG: helix-hairpin-helix domain-containing protein [Nitrospirota bacterium]